MPNAINSTVVIADPDAHLRARIASMMSPHFFTVHEAASLQATYAILKVLEPALLILGLEQPDGDALACISSFREVWSRKTLCISCLSSRNDRATKVDAFRRGADDYVVKLLHEAPMYGHRLSLLWHITFSLASDSMSEEALP